MDKYDLSQLIGKTLLSCTRESSQGDDTIKFVATTGEKYEMYYEPDCCAKCSIEDIIGDLQDLVGSPIQMAECITNSDDPPRPEDGYQYEDSSYTWTFYKLATAKGYVTIRWYGSSNGYYSETASFRRV